MAVPLLAPGLWAGEPDWLDRPTLTPRREEAPRAARTRKPAKSTPPGTSVLDNGSFERGKGRQPTGWSRLDQLTTTWVAGGPSGRGKCLRIDTDVYLSEWEKHKKALAEGRPGIAKKTKTRGPKYNTVAGTHGVHIYSGEIPVRPGDAFMLSVAMKGPTSELFFPKVFVKGYRKVKKHWREVWRGPLHCRTTPKEWRTFRWRKPKTPSKYGVQKLKVILYCYWPPGVYYIDDVRFWKVDPKAPAAGGRSRRGAPDGENRASDGEPVRY
jgi:hypothetical protein